MDKNLDSIVIIGNSKSLLNNNFGNYIDGYRYIFRCNKAAISGFERHAGTRTTHWVTTTPSWISEMPFQTHEVKAILAIHYPKDVGRNIKQIITANQVGLSIDFIDKSNYEKLVDDLDGNIPSTGMQAIVYAHHAFPNKSIDIIGFGDNYMLNTNRFMHYYENTSKDIVDHHDFEIERRYVNKLPWITRLD